MSRVRIRGVALALLPTFLVVGLLVTHAWLSVTSFKDWSLTFDETGQLTAGISYLQTRGDFRVNSEQGLLPSVLMALPVYMTVNYTWVDQMSEDWIYSQTFPLADQFLFRQGNDFRIMAFRARLAMLIQPLLLIVWIYKWSAELGGTSAGILSASMAAFSPALLAHGALCTSDMAVTLWITVALKCLWRSFHSINLRSFLVSCVALAAAFLSKMSALVLGPVTICLVVVRVLAGTPLAIELCFLERRFVKTRARMFLSLICLLLAKVAVMAFLFWAAYLFKYDAIMEKSPDGRGSFPVDWDTMYNSTFPPLAVATDFARKYKLLPEAFLYDFIHNMYMVSNRRAFFRGKYSRTGFPEYFIFCLVTKTPIALLAVLSLAAIWSLWGCGRRVLQRPSMASKNISNGTRERQNKTPEAKHAEDQPVIPLKKSPGLETGTSVLRKRFLQGREPVPECPKESGTSRVNLNREVASISGEYADEGGSSYAPLLVHITLFWTIALRSKVTIGERYVLPSYPAMYIACGSFLKQQHGRERSWQVRTWLALVLMIYTAHEVARYRPNYLAYFNGLVHPDEAWKYVVDSSLDWGQDLPRLQTFFEEKQREDPSQAFYISYFGTSSPRQYGIEAHALPSFPDLWRRQLPLRLTLDYYPGYYAISATMLWNLYSMFEFVGEWTIQLEEYYWEIFQAVAHGSRDSEVLFKADTGVFKRLCSYLQTERPPDYTIGYSILVYKLNNTELDRFCYKRESRPSLPDNPKLIFTPLRPIA